MPDADDPPEPPPEVARARVAGGKAQAGDQAHRRPDLCAGIGADGERDLAPKADAIERAAVAIAGYLTRHPAAADSVRGIAQCWLPAMGVDDVGCAAVRSALLRLQQHGMVAATRLPDGRTIYAAARRPPQQ
jgi:hypothetical protein